MNRDTIPAYLAALIPLFDRALQSPHGIQLTVSNPDRAKARLYKARTIWGDPLYDSIAITTSRREPTTKIWLYQKAEPL